MAKLGPRTHGFRVIATLQKQTVQQGCKIIEKLKPETEKLILKFTCLTR